MGRDGATEGAEGGTPPRFVIPVRDRLDQLLAAERFGPQVAARWDLPPQAAVNAPWPVGLHPRLREVAEGLGISELYRHQALAAAAALRGEHVVTVAATAAGKSLGYLLPVMDALLRDDGARALLIFPTKALARDQLERIQAWDRALGGVLAPAAYDGDTPAGARAGIRRRARLLVSNPDMLHGGILPHHAAWAPFLAGLSDLVLDELHVYRGVWGSHVANLLRRLRRVARFHGGRPRFHFSSATIANPGRLAAALAGAPVRVVDADGAPQGGRSFLIYNPPLVEPRLGLRRSAILETEALARHFLDGGLQTLVFARSRQAAELLVRYLSEERPGDGGGGGGGGGAAAASRSSAMAPARAQRSGSSEQAEGTMAAGGRAHAGAMSPLVRGYRGGYRPAERRAIEADLREGRLRGVVATNALELGIDIGQLDVCLMAGYPGSIASTRQQAGRAGRRGGESLAILVASASPLDQFIARHPDYLFGRSPEEARIDPDNLLILLDHLRCAAFELPFTAAEAERGFGVPEGGAEDADGRGAGEAEAMGSLADAGGDGSRASGAIAAEDGTEDVVAAIPGTEAPPLVELLGVLESQGFLRRAGDRWYWLAESYPAAEVNLRGGGPGTVAIVLGEGDGGGAGQAGDPADPAVADRILGTVDRASATWMLHPGAIYLHEGQSYAVEALDLAAGQAFVRPGDGSIYTRASSRVDIRPLEIRQERDLPGAWVFHGELELRSRVTSFRRLAFRSHEVLSWERLDLPEQLHVAAGYGFRLSEEALERLRAIGQWRHDPLSGRGPDWERARQEARARDNYRCRICQAVEPAERRHEVHHIRPYRQFGPPGAIDSRLANDLDNLITLCPSCHRQAERSLGLHGGLTGLGHALGHIAPLFLMCDSHDLGVATESHAAWSGGPTVVVYERAAGGLGYGETLFRRHRQLLDATRDLIRDCPCPDGCPACVGPVGEGDREAKAHALAVLGELCGG